MSETVAAHKSLLHQMTQTTETCLWNDSSCIDELTSSIGHGAVGATCNPVIVVEVLKKEHSFWRDYVQQLIRTMPTATENDISWKVVDEMTRRGAKLLEPVFNAHGGRNGRLSVQTDPRYYRDADAIVRQAVHFEALAPNIIVKIPVTHAGIAAINDKAHMQWEKMENKRVRDWTQAQFRAMGFETPESDTNFIFVNIRRPAVEFRDALRPFNVAVGRDFPPMEKSYARISLGRMEDMEKAMPFFKQVLGKTSV